LPTAELRKCLPQTTNDGTAGATRMRCYYHASRHGSIRAERTILCSIITANRAVKTVMYELMCRVLGRFGTVGYGDHAA